MSTGATISRQAGRLVTALSIAIADDEPEMLNFLERVLTRLGHRVSARAANGAGLVEACQDAAPDLIITDICMPEMDGLEAVAQIEQTQAIPVILVSASQGAETDAEPFKQCVVARLLKPVRRQDIETALTQAVTWIAKGQAA